MKLLLTCAIVAQFTVCVWATDIDLLEEKALQGDAQSAHALAEYYEAQNDTERALYWYKSASGLSLRKASSISTPLERSLLKEKAATIERTKAAYGSILTPYENDPKTLESVEHMISKVFDISPYKTNYLLPLTYDNLSHTDGRKHAETKFQISFQKNISNNLLGLHETLALGYTQTSWWQTTQDSSPFRETNYQPEIFMVMPHFNTDSFLKAYQFGLLHESNGQDTPESRSWNRMYAKAYMQLGTLIVAPRIWYRLPEDNGTDDNPNIEEYLGYGDLELVYPWGAHTFRILGRHNMHFNDESRGAITLDWMFPLWEKNLFGYIQLFSGYGESLIDYNKRSDRIGFGFALSR
jgi:phospholipase A1